MVTILGQPKRLRVLVALPTAGANLSFATARGLFKPSQDNDIVGVLNAEGSWSNFNQLLASALNAAAAGHVDLLAFLHADIAPQEYWVDVLETERRRMDADLCSAVVPIKDPRGVTSCGIGDPTNRWHPLRRFTMREVWEKLPETFDAAAAGYPGLPLLHNDGCWVADLRREVFHQTATGPDGEEELAACFDFPRRIVKRGGLFVAEGESEDWYWSRKLHELGAKTCITRRVALTHRGEFEFPNSCVWGTYDAGDEGTAARWRPDPPTEPPAAAEAVPELAIVGA